MERTSRWHLADGKWVNNNPEVPKMPEIGETGERNRGVSDKIRLKCSEKVCLSQTPADKGRMYFQNVFFCSSEVVGSA